MALDPQAAAILDMFSAMPEPDYATLDGATYRAMVEQQKLPMSNEAVAVIADHTIPVAGGTVALRVYRPASGTVPAIVFFHGGGWVACSIDTHDNMCRRLANRSGCAVISVDYRLAPENRFPGPVEDACAALRWVHAHAAMLDIDISRLAVAGDSAGGNLAAACAMLARDRASGLPVIAHQLLFYPVLDAACDTSSYDAYASGYLLTRTQMQWYWKQYLRAPEDSADARACPVRAPSFSALPGATIITAEYDPLRDEAAHYAQCLERADVSVKYTCWPGVFHGFASMIGLMKAADDALEFAAHAVRRALA